jgi:Domain of unknown function (DUF5615)
MTVRFKLDENMPNAAQVLLAARGFDCHTVHEEGLVGGFDEDLAEVCRREQRVLVTLDLDFADIRTYPPSAYTGFVVLRPSRPDRDAVLDLVERFLLIEGEALEHSLWIVDTKHVRIRR